jgi:hypothetical protein
MAFTFKASFTGVCAYVPDKEWDDQPTKIAVLMPNAGRHDELQISDRDWYADTPLRRHVPLMVFRLADIEGGERLAEDLTAIRYLYGLAVSFEIVPAALEAGLEHGSQRASFAKDRLGLSLVYTPALDRSSDEESPIPILEESAADCSWLPDLRRVIPPDCYELAAEVLDPFARSHVAARILIDRGTFRSERTTRNHLKFEPFAGDVRLASFLAHRMCVEVPDCERVLLHFRDLAAPERKIRPLVLAGDGGVAIELHAACDGNSLGWAAGDEMPVDGKVADEDFLWHYLLLRREAQERLRAACAANPRLLIRDVEIPGPVPVLRAQEGGLSLGNNCIGARLGPPPPPQPGEYNFWRSFSRP